MSIPSVFTREVPARRGYRLLVVASGIAFAVSLMFAGARIDCDGRALLLAAPQSSSKAPAKKGTRQHRRVPRHPRKARRAASKHWEPIQKAPTTDRIEEIQTALSREGYYHGDPTKKWDSNTQDAMRRFQEDHGMTGTGKLDATTLAETWARLGHCWSKRAAAGAAASDYFADADSAAGSCASTTTNADPDWQLGFEDRSAGVPPALSSANLVRAFLTCGAQNRIEAMYFRLRAVHHFGLACFRA